MDSVGKTLIGRWFVLSSGSLFLSRVETSANLLYQEKTPFKRAEFIQSVRRTHVFRAILLRTLVGIFPFVALFLFSSIIVWQVSNGNTCCNLKLVSDETSFIYLTLGWTSNVSKIFSKSVLLPEFSWFHAGIFNAFVIIIKELLKIFAIFVSCFVTPLVVLTVNFCL